MSNQCLICKSLVPAYQWNYPEPGARIKCAVCGEYRLSERLAQDLHYALPNGYIYSAIIREHFEQGIILWVENLQELKDSVVVPKNPLDSIDRILLYVMNKTKSASEVIQFKETDYPIAYAKNYDEFLYLFQKAKALGYLEDFSGPNLRLDLKGWKHLSEISQKELKPNQAFVAMWFHNDLNEVWENGLKAALEQTNYIPIRIDRTEHNEKIDDRIIAEIRKSGLLVADFTGQRGGVYFEAGFALGLGIPVIWTCRDSDVEKLHFDTRQYNHIVWSDSADLRVKLINRIEATLPNRPKPR
jgi:hypothetical protein